LNFFSANGLRFLDVRSGMTVTCPGCAAKYSIRDERLDGRRAKVRCKRCGEAFLVDRRDEVCARVKKDETRRAKDTDLFAGAATAGAEEQTNLIGERNESSVLFSLAALNATPAPPPPATTESSALIDIRALCAAPARKAESESRADDIMNLGGGGAFSPFLVAPSLDMPLPREEPRPPKTILLISAVSLALVAIAFVATTALVTRPRTTEVPPPPPSSAAPSVVASAIATEAPPAETAPPAASSAARIKPAAPIARASATPSASVAPPPAKCCPGETDTACHMRIAVGASCEASIATKPPEPPAAFDRTAAARALAIDVSSCKRPDGPTGPGHVRVTFQPTGSASTVEVDSPFGGTAVGACVAQRYRAAKVPAFTGGALSVGKTFTIP
jgi:predicted Zn finger-like uncharacterized protein